MATDDFRRHEVLGILALSAAVLLALSFGSYDARGGENWIGPFGTSLSTVLVTAFGACAWLFPVEFALAAYRMFSGRGTPLGVARAASTLVFLIVGCALLHLSFEGRLLFGGHTAGGALGEMLGEVLRALLGLAGAVVVGMSLVLITLVLRTSLSVVAVSLWAFRACRRALERLQQGLVALRNAWQEAKELEAQEREDLLREGGPKIATPGLGSPIGELLDADAYEDSLSDDAGSEDGEGSVEDALSEGDDEAEDLDGLDLISAEGDGAQAEPIPLGRPKRDGKRQPVVIAPKPPAKVSPRAPVDVPEPKRSSAQELFVLPPAQLLDAPPPRTFRIDEKVLKSNAARLVEKLAAYGVQGRVDEIHPGPVVTLYEFEPQSGTKVSKIASLADDLAMALAAQKVRIVAPIPGKARVGFELPNDHRQTVFLREVIEDEQWKNSAAALPVAFGQDIEGQPVFGDLAKMPHVLVAGATGAGKSVGINVMLVSLLLKKSPEEVRLLMIDPKVVELAVFDGIPHMLLPVVTDMKKAALALKWAVDEMERRYQLFADAGARSIVTYNERVEKVLRGEMPVEKLAPKRANKVRAQGLSGEEVLLDPVDGEKSDALDKPPSKLPYVVVVVDEFADLMMVAAKDVESAVARLAQKARAAGIHVILATQRPSVDVITGMIKANFPARIAFKVSQREDSKTILGRMGAEHLLGMGDMLIIPPGSSDLKRVHCAYISEDEVKGVCDFLRAQGAPVYDDEILKPRDDEGSVEIGGEGSGSDDPLYDRAVAIVTQAGYCSISHIQRNLSVGYNKAAKLVERMEKEGVVGPASSKAGGRREVLVSAI